MSRIKENLDHKKIQRSICLVLTLFVLLGYSLQSVAGSAYYSMVMQADGTVTSPPVILEEGNCSGTSTIYTNSTSAKVNVSAPLGGTNYPWPQGRHDTNNTGYTAAPAPKTNQTSWVTFTAASAIRSGPTVVDGVVYVASDSNYVYALDMVTGEILWSYNAGDDVRTAPAVADDKVFFADRAGNLTCLNKNTGEYLWHYKHAGTTESRSSPTVVNNGTHTIVIWGTRSNTGEPNVFARTTDNVACWEFTAGSGTDYQVNGKPAVASNGTHTLVFVGSTDNNLYAIDLNTGLQAWVYACGSDIIRGPVVYHDPVEGDLVFACAGKNVKAFDLAGNWVRDYGEVGKDIRGGVACADGKLYLAGEGGGVIYAWNISTGATLWTNSTSTKPVSWYGIPVVADGLVFVMAYDGTVYAFDMNDGTEVWKYATGATTDEAYGAVADGRLFIGSGDGNAYCFGPATSATYNYVLKIVNQDPANWTVNLQVYDNSTIDRLSSLNISLHDGTSSDQIIVTDGNITQSEGPLYDLAGNTTIYISMSNLQASTSGTSYLYVYLKILVPDTSTYALYIITFEIT